MGVMHYPIPNPSLGASYEVRRVALGGLLGILWARVSPKSSKKRKRKWIFYILREVDYSSKKDPAISCPPPPESYTGGTEKTTSPQ